MKKIVFFLLFLMLHVHIAYSQQDSVSKIPTPDFPGEPMLFIDSNYSLISLPIEKSIIKSDRRGDAIMHVAELKNNKSTFRLKSGKNRLIVTHETSNTVSMNPKDYYKIFKLEVNEEKNLRKTIVAATYVTNKSKEKHPMQEPVTVPFKKVRDGVYFIELDNLVPGEYAIITNTLDKYFTFGID